MIKRLNLREAGIRKIAKDEKFLECVNFPGYYVSNYGRVYSTLRPNEKMLTAVIMGDKNNNNDYPSYKLKNKDGNFETVREHQLVAAAFCKNSDPLRKNEVHHKNKDRYDSYYKNLQWVSRAEHKQLDYGIGIYTFKQSTGKYKQFKTIEDLSAFLNDGVYEVQQEGACLFDKQ